MLEKLENLENRFNELNDLIIKPEIISDQKKYVQLSKEYKDLKKIIDIGEVYKTLLSNISEAQEIISNEKDDEMLEMARLQLTESKEKLPEIEEELKFMLIPKDPDDSKNVVMEIRAGTGGDEASIFAGDLYRMYSKYSEGKGWKVKQLVIYPGQALSNQKHNDRSEHWWVLEGNVQIDLRWDDGRSPDWQIQMLSRNTDFIIPSGVWHKTSNIGTDLAVIVETQFGDRCEESDIIRK
mgnify:CR=1 FL=1